MSKSPFPIRVVGKTQADGSIVIDTSASVALMENPWSNPRNISLTDWQITLELSGVPTAGTATIAFKPPGGSAFCALATPLDLTTAVADAEADGTPAVIGARFTAETEAIRVTPTGLDADKTYAIIVNAN